MSHDNKKGFTLIELMIAMTFIAILLVAIAMTTVQISAIYNKGITLREVNQAGRAVSDELQRSISSSIPFEVTPKVDTSPATLNSKYVVRNGGGRLCLGRYTYAWNYGKSIAHVSGAPSVYNYYNTNSASSEPVRFAKVADPDAALCDNPTLPVPRANATEMLVSGDRDLVLHDFKITSAASDPVTGQALYAIMFVLGTNDDAQLTTNDTSCKPPSQGVGLENYCSVNQFDIIARAGNKTGSDE
jgi:prepilin-type N-terminal cleavage/methylation domain-containing protein